MKILNDTTSAPLRFVRDDGTVFGQFYLASEKEYHLAEYIPYKQPPTQFLCGQGAYLFPASRNDRSNRKVCAGCFTRLAIG